jgi:hypothetical protein
MILHQARQNTAVIFLHIPKTAGSTLHHIIRRQHPARAIYHMSSRPNSQQKFQNLSVAQRAKIKILMGHFEMGIDDYLPQPTTYFTMLRHPVRRATSYFAHVRRDPDHYCHHLVTTQQMSLDAFIRSGADVMMDNGQTRMLAGVLYTIPFGNLGPEILETAKRNIQNHFAFVGLTEQFDKALLLMNHFFGWRNLYYTRRNVSAHEEKEQLSSATTNLLHSVNQLDMALYEFAAHWLAQQVTQLEPAFSQQFARFQRLNPLLGLIAHYGDELRLRWHGSSER